MRLLCACNGDYRHVLDLMGNFQISLQVFDRKRDQDWNFNETFSLAVKSFMFIAFIVQESCFGLFRLFKTLFA